MARIVQCCNNQVLSIMYRSFLNEGWLVRAEVFDGLIAECSWGGLSVAMSAAEDACHARGWNIQLSKKPLYGNQDEPIQTIVEARMAMEKFTKQEKDAKSKHNKPCTKLNDKIRYGIIAYRVPLKLLALFI
jgi:hypothetical protein